MKWPVSKIQIHPDRQRKEFNERDLEELKTSLSLRGQINPITVHSDGFLIAGERRLRAATALGWKEIEVNIFENLTKEEQEEIQLEENIRRSDLSWQEESSAVLKLHRMYRLREKDWTQVKSADRLGMTQFQLEKYLRTGIYLERDPEKIQHCSSLSAADNIIQRIRERAIEKETLKSNAPAVQTLETIFAPRAEVADTTVAEEIKKTTLIAADESIRQADFLVFAKEFTGSPFNFIHCDFPYGINIQKSDQMQSKKWNTYDDTPEVFWKLTEALFENRDRLIAPSAHVMFWYSMTYHTQIMNMLSDYSDLVVNPVPLIWMKSDGSGVLPDPKRGPRRTYESALIITRGDRYIIKAVNNAKDAPLGKKVHLSEKPQPVLRYFFQMFLDETSTVLDPSCGSGNALAVAEEFKVKSVLGLDLDPQSVELAKATLRKGRIYQKMDNLNVAG